MASKPIALTRVFESLTELPSSSSSSSILLRCAKSFDMNLESYVEKMSMLLNNKPWTSEVESCLAELCPVPSESTVLQTLKLINDSPNASKFLVWAQRMGFSQTEASFSSTVEILSRSQNTINLDTAKKLLLSSLKKRSDGSENHIDHDRLFNVLIESYTKIRSMTGSMKLLEDIKSVGVSPSIAMFNSLFFVMLVRGQTENAKNRYNEMLNTYGVTPDTATFNILIEGYSRNRMVDEGFRLFNEMKRLDCEPNVMTYNALVQGLCNVGKVDIARNVVGGMGKKNPDLKPNIVTYASLIRGYCWKRKVDQALTLFREMTSNGIKPDTDIYNILLKGLCEEDRPAAVKEILEGATGRGEFTPDTCTFNIIINSHCRLRRLDEALKVFSEMVKLKVPQDSATYSSIICALCKERDFRSAEVLLDELWEKEILLSDSGCQPLVSVYSQIFDYLCSRGKSWKAERVFRQLLKRGTHNPTSFKNIIMGCCRDRRFEAGFEFMELMLGKDFVPNFEVYNTLIHGLLRQGKYLLAKNALEYMVKSSHRPTTFSCHTILQALLDHNMANESASFVEMMLKCEILQNISLSTKTVVLLFGSEQVDKAFELLRLLYDKGYMVNIEELVDFLCQKSQLLEARKVLSFCLPNHPRIDIELFNTVITGLSKQDNASEAFGLYYELVENELHEKLTCLEDLKTCLEAAGKSTEAKFVSKQMSKQQEGRSIPKVNHVKAQDPEKVSRFVIYAKLVY